MCLFLCLDKCLVLLTATRVRLLKGRTLLSSLGFVWVWFCSVHVTLWKPSCLTQCLKDTGAAANACFVEFFCSRIFIRFVSVPFQILDFPVPIRNCGCYFFPTSKMLSCSGKYFLPRWSLISSSENFYLISQLSRIY